MHLVIVLVNFDTRWCKFLLGSAVLCFKIVELMLVYDDDMEYSLNVCLFGCSVFIFVVYLLLSIAN